MPRAAAARPAGVQALPPPARPAPIITEAYDSGSGHSGHSGITSSQGGSPAASSLASGSLNGSALPGSGNLSDVCVFSEGGVCSADPLMQQRKERALMDAERMRNMSPEEVQVRALCCSPVLVTVYGNMSKKDIHVR